MIDLLHFLILGIVFGFSLKVTELVEDVLDIRVVTFLLDAVMLILWAFASFCAVIVLNDGNIRIQFFIMIFLGILLYCNTVHRLLRPLTTRLRSLLIALRSRLINRLKSCKKLLHLG